MAITVIATPSGTPSANDALWHVASSDNSSNTDFKYVFDIWVNGEQKIRVKPWPDPTTGKMYFDAGPTVRNEFTYEWFEPLNTTAYVAQPDMSGQVGIGYQWRIGEDFSGVTTLNMASGDVSAYNWAPPLFKRRVAGLSDRLNKWLTNRPLTAWIGSSTEPQSTDSENLFVGFYTDASTVSLKVDTFTFDNQNDNSVSGTPVAVESGFIQLNIGQTALYNELNIIIDDTIKYYDVWFNDLEKIRVYTKCNPKYQCIPIHFLNRWGLWDTLRFDLVSRLSMDVERKGFGKRDHKLTDTGVEYMSDANRYYEGKINYSNKENWTYKLNADAMTDEDYEWAAELFASPQILLETDGYFYPVTVKSNNYEYRKYVNDRLKALEVEFDFNSPRYTQLR